MGTVVYGMGNSGVKKEEVIFIPVPNVTKSDVEKAGKVSVTLNEEDITILSYANHLFAISSQCPHQKGPLNLAEIEDVPDCGPCVRCPKHRWKFDLRDGTCQVPFRPDLKMKMYPIKIDCPSHKVYIGFKEIAKKYFEEPIF